MRSSVCERLAMSPAVTVFEWISTLLRWTVYVKRDLMHEVLGLIVEPYRGNLVVKKIREKGIFLGFNQEHPEYVNRFFLCI